MSKTQIFPLAESGGPLCADAEQARSDLPEVSRVAPASRVWVDLWGKQWPIVKSPRRLKFHNPSHAALRRHVFHRDGFQCVRCGAKGVDVPDDYTGRWTLNTNTLVRNKWADVLILDHILTLRAGGRNVVENFQTLCETCNRRKGKEDKAAIEAYRKVSDHGSN